MKDSLFHFQLDAISYRRKIKSFSPLCNKCGGLMILIGLLPAKIKSKIMRINVTINPFTTATELSLTFHFYLLFSIAFLTVLGLEATVNSDNL